MSLFKVPSPKPRLARNGFDLSSRRVFSAKAGQLLPVGCWEVNPSEHFRFQVQDLVRTTTVNTAAFARMKEYYHFFSFLTGLCGNGLISLSSALLILSVLLTVSVF